MTMPSQQSDAAQLEITPAMIEAGVAALEPECTRNGEIVAARRL